MEKKWTLQNFNKRYLTSSEASIADAATQAFFRQPAIIPVDPSLDWSGVDLYDLPGEMTWPITTFAYFYIQKDCRRTAD